MTVINNLPEKLKAYGLFCCWRYEPNKNNIPTKVPYDPTTGRKAQSNKPSTFAPLEKAELAVNLIPDYYAGLGVGVFGTLVAIDIDHCIDENGKLSPMAEEIVRIMDCYTERSPSGKGLRLLCLTSKFQYDKVRYYIHNRTLGLEIYVSGCTSKFLTVTGDTLTPGKDLEERGEQLKTVLEMYMVRDTTPKKNAEALPVKPVNLTDEELIERIRQSGQAERFNKLWAGDITGYPSQSEAEQALCNILAWWTGREVERIDRLFRLSGLYRDFKWERDDYRSMTIQKAVSSCTTTYDPAEYQREQTRQGFALWAVENGVSFPESVKPPDFSDAGNAETFNVVFHDALIFVDALGWLYWNGKHWERNNHMPMSFAVELSAKMLNEALTTNKDALMTQAEAQARYAETGEESDSKAVETAAAEQKRAKEFLKHAQALRNAIRLKNMLELSKPALVVKADQLDADPFALNTPSGIVDLRTGELHEHDRTAYCSKITKASPGTDGAEMWRDFLHTITDGDADLEGFLQQTAGMALIGTVYNEGIIISFGGGRNGKSTYHNALAQTLGDYAGTIDVGTLTTDRNNKGAALATLRGKRLIITGELEEHQRLSTATLKRVGSTDKLTVEEKYKNPEEVRQSHTLVLFTNHLPRIGSTDAGTWRRLIVVPFNAVIPEGSGVQNYAEVLACEAGPAILSWAIEGAVSFTHNDFKLDVPESVRAATETYRVREDWLTNFINDRCKREPNARVGARELYVCYKTWAQELNEYVRRENDFSSAMTAAGFLTVSPKNRKQYLGIKIDHAAQFAQNPYAAMV